MGKQGKSDTGSFDSAVNSTCVGYKPNVCSGGEGRTGTGAVACVGESAPRVGIRCEQGHHLGLWARLERVLDRWEGRMDAQVMERCEGLRLAAETVAVQIAEEGLQDRIPGWAELESACEEPHEADAPDCCERYRDDADAERQRAEQAEEELGRCAENMVRYQQEAEELRAYASAAEKFREMADPALAEAMLQKERAESALGRARRETAQTSEFLQQIDRDWRGLALAVVTAWDRCSAAESQVDSFELESAVNELRCRVAEDEPFAEETEGEGE